MDGFITRANIDHFLDLLRDGDLAPQKRTIIVKLLIEEEDKFGHGQEALEFAERRATEGRNLLGQLRYLAESENDPTHLARAERLLASLEATQRLLDDFCARLRTKANSHF